MNKLSYIRWFNEIGIDDVPLVGGKNASLGEMYQNLTLKGVRVPNGFAVTAEAYHYVLEYNNAWQALHAALDGLDPITSRICRRGAKKRGRCHEPQSGLGTRHHPTCIGGGKAFVLKA